ncbi:MAG: hypothetical protein ACE5FG_04555 [Myxococcota bacterium]
MLLIGACRSTGIGPEEDPFGPGLWPFYGSDTRDWAGVRETHALGPLVHRERDGPLELFEVRPLYSRLRSPTQRRSDVLFPIAGCRARGERRVCSVLFLASDHHDRSLGSRQTQIGIAFWGRSKAGRRSGGLFPLWGVFLDRLGYDRIEFWLWPLLARATRGGYHETHLLWPFIAWGSGDGRRVWRFWPFFGESRYEGSYVRRFWLWPLIHQRAERIDADHPTYTLLILPFYGRIDTGPFASRFYLFPLYLHQWSRENRARDRIDLLWPIFTRAHEGDSSDVLHVLPFYARDRRPEEERSAVLMGLLGRTKIREEGHEEDYWRILWAGRLGTRTRSGRVERRVDLWPFYRMTRVREADGREHGYVRVPYLLPLRGLEPDGWNRHYNQLFELYSHRWRDEEARSSLLFGLREWRRSSSEEWTSWGGFLHRRR